MARRVQRRRGDLAANDAVNRGVGFLLSNQDAAGGWGYRVGGMAFVEPTALSLVTLSRAGQRGELRVAGAIQRGLSWLVEGQHEEGGWGVCAVDEEATWATGYAVLALSGVVGGLGDELATAARGAVERGCRWLLRDLGPCVSGDRQVLPGEIRPMDPNWIGWPWSEGECFWVFPSAIAILGAVAAGQGQSPRVRQGVEYLVEQSCQGGGWNFGNPYMLDKALWPAEVETAVALLALKAVGSTAGVVDEGLKRLRALLDEAASPLNLGWGLLGSRAWGQDHESAAARLAREQAADGGWRGNPFTTAVATLALDGERTGVF